jgi:hypothetical protein
LKPNGGFYEKAEMRNIYCNIKDYQTDPMNGVKKSIEQGKEKEKFEKANNQLEKKEDIRLLVLKLENLKCPHLEIPEYKDAYKVKE